MWILLSSCWKFVCRMLNGRLSSCRKLLGQLLNCRLSNSRFYPVKSHSVDNFIQSKLSLYLLFSCPRPLFCTLQLHWSALHDLDCLGPHLDCRWSCFSTHNTGVSGPESFSIRTRHPLGLELVPLLPYPHWFWVRGGRPSAGGCISVCILCLIELVQGAKSWPPTE